MFTLGISCLTTSNLPWFMDLTLQVPMPIISKKFLPCCINLGPTTDSPNWGSGKEIENPWGIWRPVDFDYRTSTGLGKQTLGGHKQTLCPGERSSEPTRDWAGLACECPGVSSRGVRWQWAALGSGALNTEVLGTVGCAGISPFEGSHNP